MLDNPTREQSENEKPEVKFEHRWQPIETAPSGEDVLLHSPDADCSVLIGHRFGDGSDEDWYPLHETWLNGRPFDIGMTHWMPLPEPPSSMNNGGQREA